MIERMRASLEDYKVKEKMISKNGHILPTGQWYAPSAVHSVILL